MIYPYKLFASVRSARPNMAPLTLCLLAWVLQWSVHVQAQIEGQTLLPTPSTESLGATVNLAPVTGLPVNYNPYDHGQLETLVQEAIQIQEAGDHQRAVFAFEQAWQTSRVAYGLYHQAQIPLLESMIASQIELEEWQSIDNHYAYLELLYTRLYDTEDVMLEAGLQKISSWHINAFNLNLDGKREQHLRKARSLLKLRLEVAANTLPAGHPKFEFLNESIRLSEQHLYLMSARHKQQLRQQERVERDRLLATLD
jgi:hypothetical protein